MVNSWREVLSLAKIIANGMLDVPQQQKVSDFE
jgi:hypothetical protein